MEVRGNDRWRRRSARKISVFPVALHLFAARAVGGHGCNSRDLRHQVAAKRDSNMDLCRPKRLSAVASVPRLNVISRVCELGDPGTHTTGRQSGPGQAPGSDTKPWYFG